MSRLFWRQGFLIVPGDHHCRLRNQFCGQCGTRWIEDVGIPCQVEIAVNSVSQSLSRQHPLCVNHSIRRNSRYPYALRIAKEAGYFATLTICNVPTSSTVRESDLAVMLQVGTEVGVASTKAFTAQLANLLLLAILLGRRRGLSANTEQTLIKGLHALPDAVQSVLALDDAINELAKQFIEKHHALFLGRGSLYPIALEGALKLKEISYIHAEGYAAGELKHGPLALVDDDMPVVAVAPNDELLEKLRSNLQEVKARGGQLFVFADNDSAFVTKAESQCSMCRRWTPSLRRLLMSFLCSCWLITLLCTRAQM